jgi:glycosyltransferase involved in cell wall biosynthesis
MVDITRSEITVILPVKNEAVNLHKCLSSLNFLELTQRVIMVDSNSQDNTCDIVSSYGAELIQFKYIGGYPKKRQWALDNLNITSPWIFFLDADEVITPELAKDIKKIISSKESHDGYLIKKQFHFLGRRFRFGGFSHSAVILVRNGLASFEELVIDEKNALDMEVHERLIVKGGVGKIKAPLWHEDFKGLEAYIDRHNKYSSWESRLRFSYFSSGSYGNSSISPGMFGGAQERRRFLKLIAMRIPFESWAWFIYHYFLRLGFLEGRPGLIASQIRASYISQVRAKIYELKKNAK